MSVSSQMSELSEMERKELNLIARGLIQISEIQIPNIENNFDILRKNHGYVGYANYYLRGCYNNSTLRNNAHIVTYKTLVAIDTLLGTTDTEQLTECVKNSVRIDLIMVRFLILISVVKVS